MTSTRRPVQHRDLSQEVRENLPSEFRDYPRRTDLTPDYIRLYDGAAKHFVIWAVREGIDLTSVDDDTLRRFRFHDCGCPLTEEGPLVTSGVIRNCVRRCMGSSTSYSSWSRLDAPTTPGGKR